MLSYLRLSLTAFNKYKWFNIKDWTHEISFEIQYDINDGVKLLLFF